MILQKGIIQIEQRAISQGAPGNNWMLGMSSFTGAVVRLWWAKTQITARGRVLRAPISNRQHVNLMLFERPWDTLTKD